MRRLGNIFKEDKKSVIVALDHGLGLDVLPGMAEVSKILTSIVAGGADAVLAGYGMSRSFVEELKGTGLIMRVDGGNSALSSFQPVDGRGTGPDPGAQSSPAHPPAHR